MCVCVCVCVFVGVGVGVCDDFHNHPPVGVAIPAQDDSSSDHSTTFLPDHIQVTK